MAPAASCCSMSRPTPTGPNLPLSGLFVDMLRRLVELSVGVASTQGTAMLAPAETLDGFGLLSQPPPAAIGLASEQVRLALRFRRDIRRGCMDRRAGGRC